MIYTPKTATYVTLSYTCNKPGLHGNTAVTNSPVSHTCEIRFNDVIDNIVHNYV